MAVTHPAVEKVLAGDKDAFAEIVETYQGPLLAYAAFRVPDASLAEEVVQRTFIRCYEQLADYRPGEDLGAWLATICRFMVLEELQRSARELRNRRHYGDVLKGQLVEAALARDPESPGGEALGRLETCLRRLPPRSRRLLACRYEEEARVSDIARQWGRSAAWVATRLFRIRTSLRRCMGQAVGSEST